MIFDEEEVQTVPSPEVLVQLLDQADELMVSYSMLVLFLTTLFTGQSDPETEELFTATTTCSELGVTTF
jgi:hypothetical protein